jgi:O-antigen ligase
MTPSPKAFKFSYLIPLFVGFFYLATKMYFSDLTRPAETFMILSGFIVLYYLNRVSALADSKALSLTLFLLLLTALMSWYLSFRDYPDLIDNSPRAEILARTMLFLPMAAILALHHRASFIALSIFILMCILMPWFSGNGWSDIAVGFKGARIDFAFRNANHGALYFGTCLIVLLSFYQTLVTHKMTKKIVWISLFLVFSLFLLFTQSRGTWLALVLVFIYFGYLKIQERRLSEGTYLWKKGLLGFAVLGSLALFLLFNTSLGQSISSRVFAESNTWALIFSGNLTDLPKTSIGIRISFWLQGLNYFLERPLFGWSTQGQTLAIQLSPELASLKGFGHLHNSWIELLINYGVIGSFLYIFSLFILSKVVKRSYQSGVISSEWLIFFKLFLFYWILVNIFEGFVLFWTGAFLCSVIFGAILGKAWRPIGHKMGS